MRGDDFCQRLGKQSPTGKRYGDIRSLLKLSRSSITKSFWRYLLQQLFPSLELSTGLSKRSIQARRLSSGDYKSSYYSWGILASGGAYVFGRDGKDFNVKDTGLAVPGAVQALSEIIELVRAEVLPKSVSYGAVEDQMAQGKLAMLISDPWAWSNLIKSGIDFGVAPIPGVKGNLGRPFVGVSVAYLNRSSPNQDLAKEFIERYLLTDEGLSAMDHGKPIGLPALNSLREKLIHENLLLQELQVCVDHGEVMPNIPQMGRFFTVMGAALQAATDGQATAEAAL